ncbi:MAG: biotin/lipoyl-binding protein [Verrucomicrobiota bacterium]|jgi:HlyD family secretion protein
MNPDEPKPEVKVTDPKPDTSSSKTEVKAAVPLAEIKTEPKPEVKATDPKPEPAAPAPEAKAAGLKPDPKAIELTHETKTAEPRPEANVEPKTEVKPELKPKADAGSKPKAGPELKPEAKADETKPATKAAVPKRTIGNKIIFTIAAIGILAGLVAAYIFGMQRKAQPPVFQPVSNPYASAIYANGMIESDLPSGENINVFPQVSGPITQVLVREGQPVPAGTPLFTIEDSVQRANTELAAANLKLARDQYDKDRASYAMDSKSISKDVLDTAEDTVNQAVAALKAATALLQYYSVKAPVDGVVLAVNAAVGGYVSSQGNYDTYTELFDPLVVMSGPQDHMDVRCYVDEILVSRLPSHWHIQAQMQIIGTDIKVPLEFVRVQPYVSPKIELSNEKQEQVDLRVLPVIFRFEKSDLPVYPGLMVDVFIGQK